MNRLSLCKKADAMMLRPRLFGARLKGLIRRIREDSLYSKVYSKYAEFTMIPRSTYRNNLSLVRSMRNVDGCVIECGVWRGGMIGGIAEILGPNRKYELFDSFEGLPQAKEIDGREARAWQADTASPSFYNNCSAPPSYATRAMQLAGARDVSLHAGWFSETLPCYKPPEPIAILRLDGDWYESTMVCLEALFPHLSAGGIVIVDDYSTWEGCRRAVHDYIYQHKLIVKIQQWCNDVTYIKNN